MKEWIAQANRCSDWSNATVVVCGLGMSGFASADTLVQAGATVIAVDASDSPANQEKQKLLEFFGGVVRLGPDATKVLPEDYDVDLIITSPGWRPDQPLLAQAAAVGIPIWGDIELAWRWMDPEHPIPWLAITGTNGKTTTTQMLESMLIAAGYKAAAVGNIGRPILEAIQDEVDYDVFAVELSSFQLHWTHSLSLHSAALLNIEPDHMEWYDGDMAAYTRDKSAIYDRVQHACIYNVADAETERAVENADVVEGARAIGFTLGVPGRSMLGVVDDLIVDRAFVEQRASSALPLADLADVVPFAPHNVENALAALARSFGAPPAAIKAGLRSLNLGGHRIQTVAQRGAVTWVDDSKATNPHAAHSGMRAFDNIIWIAGGQAKGVTYDDLVLGNRDKIKAAVLIGIDQELVAHALAQHAPEIPVIRIDGSDTSAMGRAVIEAARLAKPGDVVLLSPASASKDMFTGYDHRGDVFKAAIAALDD